ncbi:hypothetical protein FA15DRAFT_35925 [Coprinopsis marcescibilis]|uniref:Uncharacterized protein n=1 Tax=Coprinopsis marcescibilis TaxID=230819 RepID=A0A5C3LDY9_COPMA|nr:hypothetical protein FA15DRAFT_35925 [Coprinopsis marcescibilis]
MICVSLCNPSAINTDTPSDTTSSTIPLTIVLHLDTQAKAYISHRPIFSNHPSSIAYIPSHQHLFLRVAFCMLFGLPGFPAFSSVCSFLYLYPGSFPNRNPKFPVSSNSRPRNPQAWKFASVTMVIEKRLHESTTG